MTRFRDLIIRCRYDILAIVSFAVLHLVVFIVWPVGGYGYDSGQYLKMMDLGVFADLHPNGYSLVLNFVRLFSDNPSAPYAFNHVISIGTDVILYFIARLAFSRVYSLVWVLAYSLCTRALIWDEWLLTESTYFLVLALQIWLVRRKEGLRGLGIASAVCLGLLAGFGTLIRTASVLALPAILFPKGVLYSKENLKRYCRNITVVVIAALFIVLPDVLWHKAKVGGFALTQALPWNLLYGHPDTARCEPSPSQSDTMKCFCSAFSKTPRRVREFGLAFEPGSPGRILINRFGSFKDAGPHLLDIMLYRIRERPFTYLAESIMNMQALLLRSDAWYLPDDRGRFVHDHEVDPIFRKQFPGERPGDTDCFVFRWLTTGLRIPRIVIFISWLILFLWMVFRRVGPHHLHLLVFFFIAGTLLVAFGEPRYFAPVETAIACLIPLELSKLKRNRARSRS